MASRGRGLRGMALGVVQSFILLSRNRTTMRYGIFMYLIR